MAAADLIGTRPILILLTGIACDGHIWSAQCDALADLAECRTIVPQGDTIDDMAARVLAEAPQRFALAGHSMGGYVALAILRHAPDRVIRLCLINTSARDDTVRQRTARAKLIAEASAPGGFDRVIASLLPALTHRSRRHDAILAADIAAMMRRNGGDAFIRQQRAAAARPDARSHLANISVPTCIVAGGADRVTLTEHAVELAGAIDRATLYVLEDCAHLAPLEAPERVSEIMRSWLLEE